MPSESDILMRERAKELAVFVVHLKMAPSEYYNLSLYEATAIAEEYKKANSKKK